MLYTPENLNRYENFLIDLHNQIIGNEKVMMSDLCKKHELPRNTGKVLKLMNIITKTGGAATVKYSWIGMPPCNDLTKKTCKAGLKYDQDKYQKRKAEERKPLVDTLDIPDVNPLADIQVNAEKQEIPKPMYLWPVNIKHKLVEESKDPQKELISLLEEVRSKDIRMYVNGKDPLLPQPLRKSIYDFLSSKGR